MRYALERDLKHALANSEFDLCYQPVVDLETDQVRTCEALLRWNHPQRGRISPAEFIPVLETSGLIAPVGLVLEEACEAALGWPKHLTVSVNASVVKLQEAGFVDQVTDILNATGLPPSRLEIELTESVLLEDNSQAIADLKQLQALGNQNRTR